MRLTRRRTVVGLAVLSAVVAAGLGTWALTDRSSDHAQVPAWVEKAAMASATASGDPRGRVVFASKGARGWGIVMAGDFACRGCRTSGNFEGVYLRRHAAPVFVGTCETLAPCRDSAASIAARVQTRLRCDKRLIED